MIIKCKKPEPELDKMMVFKSHLFYLSRTCALSLKIKAFSCLGQTDEEKLNFLASVAAGTGIGNKGPVVLPLSHLSVYGLFLNCTLPACGPPLPAMPFHCCSFWNTDFFTKTLFWMWAAMVLYNSLVSLKVNIFDKPFKSNIKLCKFCKPTHYPVQSVITILFWDCLQFSVCNTERKSVALFSLPHFKICILSGHRSLEWGCFLSNYLQNSVWVKDENEARKNYFKLGPPKILCCML